jgi:hypothetical protein
MPGPDDKHQLRTLAQIQGRGEDIIKPLADAVEGTPDSVDPDTGQIIPGTPSVPAEEEGDSIKFKRIDGRASQRQIEVVTVDEEIVEVRGNDVFGSFTDAFGGRIDVVDGLVTTIVEGASQGWWGFVEFQWAPASAPGEYTILRMTFEAGILKRVDFGSDPGADVPSTPVAPGAAPAGGATLEMQG